MLLAGEIINVLKICKGKEKEVVKIHFGGGLTAQVKEFCYLWSMITTDAKSHREVKRRIVLEKEEFSKRTTERKLNRAMKKRMLKTLTGHILRKVYNCRETNNF